MGYKYYEKLIDNLKCTVLTLVVLSILGTYYAFITLPMNSGKINEMLHIVNILFSLLTLLTICGLIVKFITGINKIYIYAIDSIVALISGCFVLLTCVM